MAKIGIIDVDGHNYPNIPLMKISAWHKAQGDEVVWYDIFTGHCDKVYMSKVFSFTEDYGFVINADEVIKGGSGYAIRKDKRGVEFYDKTLDKSLPSEVEGMFPDYSIYPQFKDTAFGFITRGCPRNCGFCHTTQMQGSVVRKVANVEDFWNGQKKIVLFDPNITAYSGFMEEMEALKKTKSDIEFNQGLDVLLLTEKKCQIISEMKLKNLHLAFDDYKNYDLLTRKFEMLSNYFTKSQRKGISVYVLINFDTTLEQDLQRIMFLRRLNFSPYVMIYDKYGTNTNKTVKHLQRWVNNRYVFWKCETFEEYLYKN